MKNEIEFYQDFGHMTNISEYTHLIEHVPADIMTLSKITQNILIHFTDGEIFNVIHPPSRFYERNLRTASTILSRALELDSTPIDQPRSPSKRVIANCRNFSLLLIALCRAKKIPARMRVGFAKYINTGSDFIFEHALVEYWNTTTQLWTLVDPRIIQDHIEKNRFLVDFDLYDIPPNRFSYAGSIWLQCQDRTKDPNLYGYGKNREYHGLWYIRNQVMHDLAALNKFEMLPWDEWGYMHHQPPHTAPTDSKQVSHMNELSKIIGCKNIHLETSQQYFNDVNLKVPSIVISYDPLLGPFSAQIIF